MHIFTKFFLCMCECLHVHNLCAVCACADHKFGCYSSGTVQPSFFLLIGFLTDLQFAKDGRLAGQCTQIYPSLPVLFSANLILGIKKVSLISLWMPHHSTLCPSVSISFCFCSFSCCLGLVLFCFDQTEHKELFQPPVFVTLCSMIWHTGC